MRSSSCSRNCCATSINCSRISSVRSTSPGSKSSASFPGGGISGAKLEGSGVSSSTTSCRPSSPSCSCSEGGCSASATGFGASSASPGSWASACPSGEILSDWTSRPLCAGFAGGKLGAAPASDRSSVRGRGGAGEGVALSLSTGEAATSSSVDCGCGAGAAGPDRGVMSRRDCGASSGAGRGLSLSWGASTCCTSSSVVPQATSIKRQRAAVEDVARKAPRFTRLLPDRFDHFGLIATGWQSCDVRGSSPLPTSVFAVTGGSPAT